MLSKNVYTVHIKGLDKTIEIQEVSMMECLSMYEQLQSDKNAIMTFVLDFCKTHGLDFRKVKIEALWTLLSDKYFGGFFAKNKPSDPQAPIESMIDFIGERYGVNPFKMLSEITYTQFKALLEGAKWNLNETTEKGKNENAKWRREHMDKGAFKSRLDKLDDIINNREKLIKEGKLKQTYKQKL